MNVKERLYGAITVMAEEEAERIWDMIQKNHGYGYEEEEPTPEEKEAFEAYRRGDEEYQPYMTHAELVKEIFETS